MHVLIVDPADLARARLRRLLARVDSRLSVEELSHAVPAVERIARQDVDLVLLEIQLPDLDGFAVVRAVGREAMPPFAFTTTTDAHALDAYSLDALGYLIKPVIPDQLASLVRRAALLRAATQAAERSGTQQHVARLAVRGKGETIFVRVEDITWIEAQDMRIRVHTAGESYEVRESISNVERLLSPRDFVRVHRGAIVRVDRIRAIQTWFRGDYVIIMMNGAKITTGHSYRTIVRGLLKHR